MQKIFDTTELIANFDRKAVKVERSIYDYVVYDSNSVELLFAVALGTNQDVKMPFKIPNRFKTEEMALPFRLKFPCANFFLKHILPLSANNIKAEIFRQRRKIYESNRYRPKN